ncbi:PD-(D/E)XK nuclease family protein [uncultured Draconibacterium sp.]|uniref:PDDEXK-like family protein n=1 Tax=uncultured Draconibacterium sp. TaxID=1573823 RepID=UPI002AA604F2|nr:PD-(D/E)XK nuclease family protein [uncultured Draconibacterium sp.]
MENFLKQLYIIAKEYKMLADREEKFNIFAALHKIHDERRLHSRFISVLLQPNGSHGFGNQFLDLFIKKINDTGVPLSSIEADEEVEFNNNEQRKLTEYKITEHVTVYPSENDKKENSNIDILIIDRFNKQCLIVENKIYAGDSNGSGGQLNKYIEHVELNENIPLNDISVVYLTLDGHEPTKTSIKKYSGRKEIILCSYLFLIIPWLEECLTLTARTPYLRESILQYIKLIKKMTIDDSSVEERKAYRNLIGESEDNMLAAKKLYDNFKHVKWHAVADFWRALQQKIEENNYTITKRVVELDGSSERVNALTHYEIYRKGQSKKQQCFLNFTIDDGLEISIRFTPNWKFYFGVDSKTEVSTGTKLKLEQIKKDSPQYESPAWMHIAKKFDNNIHFNNFRQELAFDLISPRRNKELVEATWDEVEAFIKDCKE